MDQQSKKAFNHPAAPGPEAQVIAAGRKSQIAEEIELLSDVILLASDRIQDLHGRLTPVLRGAEPDDKREDPPPPSLLVPVATEIRVAQERIGGLIRVVLDILDRLEV